MPILLDSISVLTTNLNGNMVTSTGTIESVNKSMNGKMVGCKGTFNVQTLFDLLTINVTG